MNVHARTDAWIDVVADLLRRPWTPGWHRVVMPLLSETFDAPVGWNWTRPDGSFGVEVYGMSKWPTVDRLLEWQREVRATHPFIRWYAATNDTTALTMARVPAVLSPRRDFEEVRDFYTELDIEQQLSVPMFVRGHQHLAFVLARTGADFSDEGPAAGTPDPTPAPAGRPAGARAWRSPAHAAHR